MPNNSTTVIWSNRHPRGCWDDTIFQGIFARGNFTHITEFANLRDDGAVVMFPAAHHQSDLAWINREINRLKWCVMVVYGDEENLFPAHLIRHPNMKLWYQCPIPGVHDFADRKIIFGYTPDTVPMIEKNRGTSRDLDWSFAGQVQTWNTRRIECVEQLQKFKDADGNGLFFTTPGFNQGLTHEEYYELMCSAKVIPCPSGNGTPDSFRLAEALEAGCVPIADGRNWRPHYPSGYWQNAFMVKDLCEQGYWLPFPIIDDWADLPNIMKDTLANWDALSRQCRGFWGAYKRELCWDMDADIAKVKFQCR